jgi:hypothetical protein
MHNKQIVRQISAPVPQLVAIRTPRLTRTNGLKFQTQAAPSRHPQRQLHQMSGEISMLSLRQGKAKEE